MPQSQIQGQSRMRVMGKGAGEEKQLGRNLRREACSAPTLTGQRSVPWEALGFPAAGCWLPALGQAQTDGDWEQPRAWEAAETSSWNEEKPVQQ